jgi:hypothetical protein
MKKKMSLTGSVKMVIFVSWRKELVELHCKSSVTLASLIGLLGEKLSSFKEEMMELSSG